MKHTVRIIALALLAICLAQVVNLSSYGSGNARVMEAAGRVAAAPATPAAATLAVGTPVRVDMVAERTGLDGLSGREVQDQRLDWLLFAAVSTLGKTSEEYSKIFFDLPTLRQGYMRPVGSFEYGQTRSRYIGDGAVLAIVPAGASPAQRKDELASIADQQRKNLGGPLFKRMLVVEYAFAGSQATLTRRDDVAFSSLFSAEYGYSEQQVSNVAELERFMRSVDDLTAVTVKASGLLVGGRKIQGSPYRAITLDLVATVWQAERALQKGQSEWQAFLNGEEAKFNAKWAGRRYEPDYQVALQAVKNRIASEARVRGTGSGTGFSLDPDIDLAALRTDFDRLKPKLAESKLGDEQSLSTVSTHLRDGDVVPYLRLVQSVDQAGDGELSEMLQDLRVRHSFQKARYDGDLQGTEVGMVLFYTDLLAKLWVIDYESSSPSHRSIRDFVDGPSMHLSAAYHAERLALSHARLWFGHSNQGVQFADNGQSVLFARNATRIFSAGSSEFKPGVEVQTSAALAAPIEWWNDHYEEVARLEPEYQRLNEIMKWSVVIAWLSGKEQAQRLEYLASVPVDRSNVFPKWAANQPELRFKMWDRIGFHRTGYKGLRTESLPMLVGGTSLAGFTLSGGVTLASKEVAQRVAVRGEVSDLVRRSALDYGRTSGSTAFRTLDDAAFVFKAESQDVHKITASAKEGTKLRGSSAQLRPAEFERTTRRSATAMALETRAAETPIGELTIEQAGNGLSLGWKARELAQAHTLAKQLSLRGLGEPLLYANPHVERIIALGAAGEYAVKLKGSRRWIHLAPEKQASVDIDRAWELRAAYPKEMSSGVVQAAVVDESRIAAVIAADKHLVADAGDGSKVLLRLAADAPPQAGLIGVDSGSTTGMKAWVDSRGGVHISAADNASAFRVAADLRQEDIAAIRLAAKEGRNSVRITGPDGLLPSLEKANYRAAAENISRDPVAAKAVLDKKLAEDLARNAQIRGRTGFAEALHDLDALIAVHGPQPDLLLRRGLIQIRRGNVEAAAAALKGGPTRKLADRGAFFDEVNAMRQGADASADDILRFAQIADFREAEARGIHAAFRVEPRIDGSRLDIDMTLLSMPGDGARVANAANLSPGLVYRQKSAGLDKVDWTASMDQALAQVIVGGLGKVVRVPRGLLADYRPAAVWSPDHKAEFVWAPGSAGSVRPTLRGIQACNTGDEPGSGCFGDRNARGQQQDVYLVVAN